MYLNPSISLFFQLFVLGGDSEFSAVDRSFCYDRGNFVS